MFLSLSSLKKKKMHKQGFLSQFAIWERNHNKYRKVKSSNTSRLGAHEDIYRLLMKGNFNACLLWPFDKKFILN